MVDVKKNLFLGLEALKMVLVRQDVASLNLHHDESASKDARVTAIEDCLRTNELVLGVERLLSDPILHVSS